MKLYLISGIIAFAVGVLASVQTVKELDSKYNGEFIQATCVKTPSYCTKKNNTISVE